MNAQADKLIGTAREYTGYLEKATDALLEEKTANAGSGNYTVFGKWYDAYYKTRGFNGAAWCHAFVSYCAMKAGIGPDVIPYTASCKTGVSWFRQHSRWQPRDGCKPKVGNIIYFSSDGASPSHVGIVVKSEGSRVFTIEGNTSGGSTLIANGGGVAEKNYPISYKCILGYGIPDYQEDVDMTIQEVKNELTTVKGTGAAHSAWASEAVGAFTDAGVFNGDGQGNFGWGQCLTREGAAELLYNLLERLELLDALKKGARS